MNEDMERRFLESTPETACKIEQRSEGDKKQDVLTGYAIVFGRRSNDLGGFVEEVHKNALDELLASNPDVRATVNHKDVIGRTSAGTLKLAVDSVGLRYEVVLGQSRPARDVLEAVQRKDVTGSSFSFKLAKNGDKWEERDGKQLRTLMKITRLFDVGPVDFPAYEDTTVALRSMPKSKMADAGNKLKIMERGVAAM